jgi:hypothetical protein
MNRLLTAATLLLALLGVQPAGADQPRWFQPLLSLPNRPVIRCILMRESRSTFARPNLTDRNLGQFGPFQFTTLLWDRWSWVAGVGHKTRTWYLGTSSLDAVTVPAYRSSLYQQALVFATVARDDGLWPWTNFDGC